MATAIILLKIDPKKITGTAEKLLEIHSVTDVYSISGRYDLLVIIKCDSIDMIESVITDHLLKCDGIIEHEALDCLAAEDPRKAELVKLRYFAGMSIEEAAGALGISDRTAKRDWTYARAWLGEAIERMRGTS